MEAAVVELLGGESCRPRLRGAWELETCSLQYYELFFAIHLTASCHALWAPSLFTLRRDISLFRNSRYATLVRDPLVIHLLPTSNPCCLTLISACLFSIE